MWWFHIFIYLKLIDIINLHEVVNGYKQFEDHPSLAKTVIDTTELNSSFMKHFDKLIIRLCGHC